MIPCAQPGSLRVVTTKSGFRSVKFDTTKHELLRTEVNMLQLERNFPAMPPPKKDLATSHGTKVIVAQQTGEGQELEATRRP